MYVAELWRYPVKSMGGERLEEAEVLPDGIRGDRFALVARGSGVITARTHPRLLLHRAAVGNDGEALVDGWPWTSAEAAEIVRAAAGTEARLVRAPAAVRFDILPLLVATDGAIEAFGYGGRRLRPNIVIGGVEGLAERSWEGRSMQIGATIIAIEELRQRCVMTTYDPDTAAQNIGVLRKIVRDFGGLLALNAFVVRPGTVRLGDPVTFAP